MKIKIENGWLVLRDFFFNEEDYYEEEDQNEIKSEYAIFLSKKNEFIEKQKVLLASIDKDSWKEASNDAGMCDGFADYVFFKDESQAKNFSKLCITPIIEEDYIWNVSAISLEDSDNWYELVSDDLDIQDEIMWENIIKAGSCLFIKKNDEHNKSIEYITKLLTK